MASTPLPLPTLFRASDPLGEQDGAGLEAAAAPEQSSDQALLDRAFTGMVERHASFLYRLAFSLLGNAQDAQDAVQDCLLKQHRSAAWRGAADEKAFLARSCWRAALDRLPQRQVALAEVTRELRDPAATPDEATIQGDLQAKLHGLIDALPLKLREPLLLSGFEDLTSREIGAILRIPEGTVRTRLKTARDELRKRWERMYGKPNPARAKGAQ